MTWRQGQSCRSAFTVRVINCSSVIRLIASCWCCYLTITCAIPTVSSTQVYASSAHLQSLAEGERVALEALRQHINDERSRFEEIARLMEEVQTVHDEERRSGLGTAAITGNPLQAFHLIRRFSTIWRSIAALIANNSSYLQLKAAMLNLGDYLPGDTDLTNSMLALVRLQRTYGLDISDLIRGVVAGQQSAALDQKTVFEMALLCLGNGEPDTALLWLANVINYTTGEQTISQPAILQTVGRAYAQKQDFPSAIHYIQKAVELDPYNAGYLIDILPPPHVQVKVEEIPQFTQHYYELCREAAYNTQQSLDSSIECQLRPSRRVPFQNFKLEFIHRNPDICLWHDIVSDRESLRLQKMAASKISRAMVGSTVEAAVSEVRVGKIAWLYDEDPEELVRKISWRVADMTGLNTSFPSCEPLQMSNYGLGGHYDAHYDHDELRFTRSDPAPEVAANGDRIASLLIYLNDVTVGGATVFPKLNLAAKPVKNAGIFWYNYKRNGEMESLSLHAGCPVLVGEKWVANKWIREYGQEFYRPCALERDE